MAEETKTYVFGEGNGSGLGAGFIPGMLGGLSFYQPFFGAEAVMVRMIQLLFQVL